MLYPNPALRGFLLQVNSQLIEPMSYFFVLLHISAFLN